MDKDEIVKVKAGKGSRFYTFLQGPRVSSSPGGMAGVRILHQTGRPDTNYKWQGKIPIPAEPTHSGGSMRKLRYTTIIGCALLGWNQVGYSAPWLEFAEWNGHTYVVLNYNTWEGAQNIAQNEFGGYLVAISSIPLAAQEQNFLHTAFAVEPYFIGLSDRDVEGQWSWTDGVPLTIDYWASGQPDNQGNEDVAVMNWNQSGEWADVSGVLSYKSIIEIEGTGLTLPPQDPLVVPVPGAFALVTTGIAFLSRVRRRRV